MFVRGIVRSLLVLSTFVLGGGGGSVTIGQYSLFVWATVVGIGVRVLGSTVCGSWSPGNHVSLEATRARLVASPAVTGKRIQSLWGVCTELYLYMR